MYYVGIDLGGTNIAAGLVTEDGKIIFNKSIPTRAERDWKEIVADMASLAKEVIAMAGVDESEVAGVGIGCPGSIDNENGICAYSNNIKMEKADISGEFRKHFDIPVNLENDANAAALGEYEVNGKGAKSYVFVTLGTGIGGGIILDGKIFRGHNGVGAEIGHTVIVSDGEKCTCGRCGCWEAYGSVTALIRQTKEAMEKNPDTILHKLAEKEGKVTGKMTFDAAQAGDKVAKEVLDNYFRYVAEGITNMVNVLQPEKVVIGGSVSKQGDYLLNPIKALVNRDDYNRYMHKAEVEIATLFGDAGIIGAALSARK